MSSLNWDKEFALEQAADDAELLEELLGIFRDSCANDLKQIKEGIDSNNPEIVAGAAHSIKGAAASLGILTLRDMALAIELEAKHGRFAGVEERFSLLAALVEELGKI